MGQIIEWCNSNQGFISAVLSIISLLISVIAVTISIVTSRLPYKKKILLTSNLSYEFVNNKMIFAGIETIACNIGNMPINLSYLGLGWKENGKIVKVYSLNRKMTGTGVLKSQEKNSNFYAVDDIDDLLNKTINNNRTIYVVANDVGGRIYKRKCYKSKVLKKLIEM